MELWTKLMMYDRLAVEQWSETAPDEGQSLCKEAPSDGLVAWGWVPCPAWMEPVAGCLHML